MPRSVRAPRLHRHEAILERHHLSGENVVAILQTRAHALLGGDLALQLARREPTGLAEPETNEHGHQQQHADDREHAHAWLGLHRNSSRPRYSAAGPSMASMRSSRLYFATRSVREQEPVLICPAPVATAKSAMVVSFGFPRTVGDHGPIARVLRHADRGKGLGQGADLIRLDEDGVGDAFADAAPEQRRVGRRTGRRRPVAPARRAGRSTTASRPSRPRRGRLRWMRSESGPPRRRDRRESPRRKAFCRRRRGSSGQRARTPSPRNQRPAARRGQVGSRRSRPLRR